MAKVTQTANGATGLTARTNFNTAIKSVEADATITGDGNVGTPLSAATALAAKEATASKDATGGYAGLTLLKINFKNVANTVTSFFTNTNTAARTYTFQDRNGTITDDTDLALYYTKAEMDTLLADKVGNVTSETGTGKVLYDVTITKAAHDALVAGPGLTAGAKYTIVG